MDAAQLLRSEARKYARLMMLARLGKQPRNVVWRPMALKLIRLARQIDAGES